MINVSVSQLYNTSKSKADGFLDEAYRRGKKVSSWLEFTEEDYNFLKNNFNHSAPEETPAAPEETPAAPEETPAAPEETPEASEETLDP